MPKLYFYDSGVVCFLLGIESPIQLQNHQARGAIFEGFVISEMSKKRFNKGKSFNLYFWRDHLGVEIDIVHEIDQKIQPIEIKSSETFQVGFSDNLRKFEKISNSQVNPTLVYCGQESFTQGNIIVQPWEQFCLDS